MNTNRQILLVCTVLALSACQKQEESTSNYIQRIKSGAKHEIKPLKKPEIAKEFNYSVYNYRDPFSLVSEGNLQNKYRLASDRVHFGPDVRNAPNPNRKKEFLETFPLDSLRLVGTLQKGDKIWGLIKDKGGLVHRVLPGNYIGTDYGKIVSIESDSLSLEERFEDSIGNWRIRETRLTTEEKEE